MRRRRIRNSSVPRRRDRRRPSDAQRRPRRGRRGQAETIAERRVRALELRKAGGSYRQIAKALAIDTHTAWADVAAELAALRETTVGHAEELRDPELARFDEMTSGLWPQIRAGSPPAVTAAVRVSERRSRLLGLDEPSATRTEISGSLSVDAERRLKAETEDLQRWLTFEELRELGENQKGCSLTPARSCRRAEPRCWLAARRRPPRALMTSWRGEPTEQSTAPTVSDQRDAAGAETAPPDMS